MLGGLFIGASMSPDTSHASEKVDFLHAELRVVNIRA